MSDRLHFAVLSSDGVTRYDVQAYATANGVRFACNCKAGENDQVCKHRLSLALGDTLRLVSDNAHQIVELQALLGPSQIIPAIKQLQEWEDVASKLKSAIATLKRDLILAMHG